MRNYHNSAAKTFVTFAVNDEYFVHVEDIYTDLVKAVADTLGVTHLEMNAALTAAFGLLTGKPKCDDDDFYAESAISLLTPSEIEVIVSLARFCTMVSESEKALDQRRGSYPLSSSKSWCYHNLNTGLGVVWTHLVK